VRLLGVLVLQFVLRVADRQAAEQVQYDQRWRLALHLRSTDTTFDPSLLPVTGKRLGQIVFNSPTDLQDLNQIMLNPILVRLKREFANKNGILILNGALLAEAGIMHLCNNNIILIKCDKKIQETRLSQRGLSKSQIQRRILSQYSFSMKHKAITAQIQKDFYGKLWVVSNSDRSNNKQITAICSAAKTFLGGQ
jgi:dephospho-CoA kinase